MVIVLKFFSNNFQLVNIRPQLSLLKSLAAQLWQLRSSSSAAFLAVHSALALAAELL